MGVLSEVFSARVQGLIRGFAFIVWPFPQFPTVLFPRHPILDFQTTEPNKALMPRRLFVTDREFFGIHRSECFRGLVGAVWHSFVVRHIGKPRFRKSRVAAPNLFSGFHIVKMSPLVFSPLAFPHGLYFYHKGLGSYIRNSHSMRPNDATQRRRLLVADGA